MALSLADTGQTGKFTEKQPFTSGTDRCVSCPRIHLLRSVELFLLPIPTIKEWILFVSIARFPKLPTKHLCLLEPGIRWQWWHHFCGFVCGFVNIHLITMVRHTTSKDPKSMVPNGTFSEVSVSSSSQFPTPFPMGADFGSPPLT